MEAAISCRARGNELSVALWELKCLGELLRMLEASQPELTGGPRMEIQIIIPQVMRVMTGTGSADYE